MPLCPICKKSIRVLEGNEYDCTTCKAKFEKSQKEQGELPFELPPGLNRSKLTYYYLVKIAEKINRLEHGGLTPETYDLEVQKIVDEINAQGTKTVTQIAAEAEQKCSADYAAKLRKHW